MRSRALLTGILVAAMAAGVFAAEQFSKTVAPPSMVFELLSLNRDLGTKKKPKYRSPIDMETSPDQKKIYISEQTAKRIAIFDVEQGVISGYIRFPNEVTGCAVSLDGTQLYVTIGSDLWPGGYVCVTDIASGRILRRIKVGHYPRSPVLTPDGAKLFVCNMFGNNLSVINMGTFAVDSVGLVREPYCADLTPDGKTLVIGNSLPNDRSTDTDYVSCMITLFDVEKNKVDTNIRLTRGSHSVFGLTVTPDGKYAFAMHLIGKFNLIGTTVERGWLHTNNMAMIDIQNRRFVNDVCLDLASVGMSNPWGVRCTDDGEFMAVVHAGSNELSVIKLKDLIDTANARTARGDDMQKDFTSMLDSRKRYGVGTKGPRALAIIGDSIYTTGYFDDVAASMEVFDVTQTGSRPKLTYSVGTPMAWTGERNGESNYYDGALCFQKWQSCHSCHPLTRPDALNWILGGGATPTPKNAKSMLYAWWTPPTTWTGRRGHCQTSIIAGIELELFRVATRDLAAPLDTFFMGMKPLASPKLVKGRLSPAAQRGKAIYYNPDKVDCIVCHPAPLFTDSLFWNTGVPDPFDANTQWVTPSLVEAWRTGPYGHLGSFWGIREILELPGHTNASKKLTMEEIDDLVEFVESL